jgi:death-on-curing protein
VEQGGGAAGLRDLAARSRRTGVGGGAAARHLGGTDLHATLAAKAAALGYSLALSHAFVGANERVAHAALETFLVPNGGELAASVDEAERPMLALAAGEVSREQLTTWVEAHLVPLPG